MDFKLKLIAIYTLMFMLMGAISDGRAQNYNIPNTTKTVKLYNKETNEPIGTITFDGNRSYLRDKDGVHLKTMVRNEDGTISAFDPNGKLIETVPNPVVGPQQPQKKK